MNTGVEGTVIAFVTSAGGVLPDVLTVADSWPGSCKQLWVAPPSIDTRATLHGRSVHWVDEPSDHPRSMLTATRSARAHLRHQRVDWVVSAGTAIAVPYFIAAKSLSVPSIWVETLNIHGGHGRVAELCSRLATRTLVQSPDRLVAHRRAILVGELQ